MSNPATCLPLLKAKRLQPINSLVEISPSYQAIFCDVWGVVHNGVVPFQQSVDALIEARKSGLKVVLVTNAPRPFQSVVDQLGDIGVAFECYDAIVTSGDVTRGLIEKAAPKILHIGSTKEAILYDGLNVELVDEAEVETIVVTGLYNDDVETPADYVPLLARLKARNIPMICANPDIMVERGDRMIWCGGAIARDYAALGGVTSMAGKPHRHIYEAAHKMAEELSGQSLEKSQILAIGDGLFTDIKGAADFGIDALYIAAGIHAHEYAGNGNIDEVAMKAFIMQHGFAPVASMARLA
jgi:HAD superfamily hydrolase (TIGR01459 family)